MISFGLSYLVVKVINVNKEDQEMSLEELLSRLSEF